MRKTTERFDFIGKENQTYFLSTVPFRFEGLEDIFDGVWNFPKTERYNIMWIGVPKSWKNVFSVHTVALPSKVKYG